MKLKYPAEAFALCILLFSAGMREAFAAGILALLVSVFAECFHQFLLHAALPDWSHRLCVYMASGAVSASAFLLGFSYLGNGLTAGFWAMTFVVGLLAARHTLSGSVDADYGGLFLESALAWGLWILLAALREFMGTGSLFGFFLYQGDIQSKMFLESTFAFLTAGLVLAFVNGAVKKSARGLRGILVVVPAAILIRPFAVESAGELFSTIWTILVPIALFLCVRRTLRFSQTGRAYRGLPVEMLAMGFIYMILSIY